MPFYEYRCNNCDHQMEVLQKISDSPLVDCPQCAQPALKKLVSAAAFRLKGSGWYETDFKSDGKKNLHESAREKDAGDKDGGSNETGKKGTSEKSESATAKDGKTDKPASPGKATAKPQAAGAD